MWVSREFWHSNRPLLKYNRDFATQERPVPDCSVRLGYFAGNCYKTFLGSPRLSPSPSSGSFVNSLVFLFSYCTVWPSCVWAGTRTVAARFRGQATCARIQVQPLASLLAFPTLLRIRHDCLSLSLSLSLTHTHTHIKKIGQYLMNLCNLMQSKFYNIKNLSASDGGNRTCPHRTKVLCLQQ